MADTEQPRKLLQSPSKLEVKVGDRVVLDDDRTGVVRFVGKVHFSPKVTAGVELDQGFQGESNGTMHGWTYFEAPENTVTFVDREACILSADETESDEESNSGSSDIDTDSLDELIDLFDSGHKFNEETPDSLDALEYLIVGLLHQKDVIDELEYCFFTDEAGSEKFNEFQGWKGNMTNALEHELLHNSELVSKEIQWLQFVVKHMRELSDLQANRVKSPQEYKVISQGIVDFFVEQIYNEKEEVRLRVVKTIASILWHIKEHDERVNSEQGVEMILLGLKKLVDKDKRKQSIWELFISNFANEGWEYQRYCVRLVNFMIMSFPILERRVAERRVLSMLGFQEILSKAVQVNVGAEHYDKFLDDIDLYKELEKDDRVDAALNGGIDFSDPDSIYQFIKEESLKDGNINYFVHTLHSLATIPSLGDSELLWKNCQKIVNMLTLGAREEMLGDLEEFASILEEVEAEGHTLGDTIDPDVEAELKEIEDISHDSDESSTYASDDELYDFPTFAELKLCVKAMEEKREKTDQVSAEIEDLKDQLNDEQLKRMNVMDQLSDSRKELRDSRKEFGDLDEKLKYWQKKSLDLEKDISDLQDELAEAKLAPLRKASMGGAVMPGSSVGPPVNIPSVGPPMSSVAFIPNSGPPLPQGKGSLPSGPPLPGLGRGSPIPGPPMPSFGGPPMPGPPIPGAGPPLAGGPPMPGGTPIPGLSGPPLPGVGPPVPMPGMGPPMPIAPAGGPPMPGMGPPMSISPPGGPPVPGVGPPVPMPGMGPPMPGMGPPMSMSPPGGPPVPGVGPPVPMPGMGPPMPGMGPPMSMSPPGGPPLGPPMPGIVTMAVGMPMQTPAKKKAIFPPRDWGSPKHHMLVLRWATVKDKKGVGSPFWKSLILDGYDDPEQIKPIPEDFEEEFSRKSKKKAKKKKKEADNDEKGPEGAKSPKSPKIRVSKIISDGKRNQAVGMSLGALKLKTPRDFERMRLNLLHLNELNLASLRPDAVPESDNYVEIMEDLITAVEVTMPTPEEILELFKWDGKHFNAYDRVDKYMLTMRLIPDARQRAAFWKFKISLQRDMKLFEEYIDSIRSTCEIIVTSSSLKKIFGIVIRIGNYMNHKSKKHQTRVFMLSSLDQLTSCKSKRNVTLLSYIVGFVRKFHPECLSFVKELSELTEIARQATTVQDKETELMQSSGKLKDLRKFVMKDPDWPDFEFQSDVIEALKSGDEFKSKMIKFLDEFESKCESVVKDFEDMKSICKDLASQLFYKKEKGHPEFHHLGILSTFRNQIEAEISRQKSQEEAEEKKKSRLKAKDEKLDKLSKSHIKRKLRRQGTNKSNVIDARTKAKLKRRMRRQKTREIKFQDRPPID